MLLNLAVGLRSRSVPADYVFLGSGALVEAFQRKGLAHMVIHAGHLREVGKWMEAIRAIRASVKQSEARLVIDWMMKARLYGGVAAASLGVPSGVWLHDYPGTHWMDRLARTIPLHRVWASSRSIAESPNWCGPTPMVVHPGVDVEEFVDSPTCRPTAVHLNARSADTFTMGVVARLARWKGIDQAIHVLHRLGPPGQLIVVGGDHFGDPGLREVLIGLARELGVDSRLQLVGHQTDVVRWMHSFDVLLHITTRPNPADQVVKEAMACGVPVVASSGGYASEVIVDGRNGVLVQADNLSDIVTRVAQLRDDVGMRVRLARAGSQTIREQFTMSSMVDAFVESLAPGSRGAGVPFG